MPPISTSLAACTLSLIFMVYAITASFLNINHALNLCMSTLVKLTVNRNIERLSIL